MTRLATLFALLSTTLLITTTSYALPIPKPTPLRTRQAANATQAVTTFQTLSTPEISSFAPFSFYASTGYCKPEVVLNWTCGPNCDANPNFTPVAAGGDGILVQFWYVGYDLTLGTVIVGHQGTDPDKIIPLITDVKFFLTAPNATLFPTLGPEIELHNGFSDAHAETADAVLAAVKTALARSHLNKVTLVGHSLGAALSLLDAVFLPQFLPGVEFKMFGYGMPRVGNQAWADFVDANVDIARVNNKEDLIPTLPGRFLGFSHSQGEKHIQDDLSWVACPGQDNTDERCSTGDVRNVFQGSISDHNGPYDIVTMGCD